MGGDASSPLSPQPSCQGEDRAARSAWCWALKGGRGPASETGSLLPRSGLASFDAAGPSDSAQSVSPVIPFGSLGYPGGSLWTPGFRMKRDCFLRETGTLNSRGDRKGFLPNHPQSRSRMDGPGSPTRLPPPGVCSIRSPAMHMPECSLCSRSLVASPLPPAPT